MEYYSHYTLSGITGSQPTCTIVRIHSYTGVNYFMQRDHEVSDNSPNISIIHAQGYGTIYAIELLDADGNTIAYKAGLDES